MLLSSSNINTIVNWWERTTSVGTYSSQKGKGDFHLKIKPKGMNDHVHSVTESCSNTRNVVLWKCCRRDRKTERRTKKKESQSIDFYGLSSVCCFDFSVLHINEIVLNSLIFYDEKREMWTGFEVNWFSRRCHWVVDVKRTKCINNSLNT